MSAVTKANRSFPCTFLRWEANDFNLDENSTTSTASNSRDNIDVDVGGPPFSSPIILLDEEAAFRAFVAVVADANNRLILLPIPSVPLLCRL